jgi:hypothetical protein
MNKVGYITLSLEISPFGRVCEIEGKDDRSSERYVAKPVSRALQILNLGNLFDCIRVLGIKKVHL